MKPELKCSSQLRMVSLFKRISGIHVEIIHGHVNHGAFGRALGNDAAPCWELVQELGAKKGYQELRRGDDADVGRVQFGAPSGFKLAVALTF